MTNQEALKVVLSKLKESMKDAPHSTEGFEAIENIIDKPGVYPALMITAAAAIAVQGKRAFELFVDTIQDCASLLPEEEKEAA